MMPTEDTSSEAYDARIGLIDPQLVQGVQMSQKFFTVSRNKGGCLFREWNKRRRRDWSHLPLVSHTVPEGILGR